jgi:hypothetical protein
MHRRVIYGRGSAGKDLRTKRKRWWASITCSRASRQEPLASWLIYRPKGVRYKLALMILGVLLCRARNSHVYLTKQFHVALTLSVNLHLAAHSPTRILSLTVLIIDEMPRNDHVLS